MRDLRSLGLTHILGNTFSDADASAVLAFLALLATGPLRRVEALELAAKPLALNDSFISESGLAREATRSVEGAITREVRIAWSWILVPLEGWRLALFLLFREGR